MELGGIYAQLGLPRDKVDDRIGWYKFDLKSFNAEYELMKIAVFRMRYTKHFINKAE